MSTAGLAGASGETVTAFAGGLPPPSNHIDHTQSGDPTMALSSIALCSRALLKLGASTIASFDEGTAEAEVSANLYPPVRDALLSAHPWNFATGQIGRAHV